jgi:hypothetical protein
MEPEGSVPNSQELSTCFYPWPDQSLAMMHNVLFLLFKFENTLFLQQIKYALIMNQDKLSNPFAFIR